MRAEGQGCTHTTYQLKKDLALCTSISWELLSMQYTIIQISLMWACPTSSVHHIILRPSPNLPSIMCEAEWVWQRWTVSPLQHSWFCQHLLHLLRAHELLGSRGADRGSWALHQQTYFPFLQDKWNMVMCVQWEAAELIAWWQLRYWLETNLHNWAQQSYIYTQEIISARFTAPRKSWSSHATYNSLGCMHLQRLLMCDYTYSYSVLLAHMCTPDSHSYTYKYMFMHLH